jgi:peptidoglycan/xylan/chitin deacetylase (PgdA/CDA1 family)
MSGGSAEALRLDDVGAASKQHEVYGVTRIRLGPLALPFPGNFLFLKYLPPVKRWGPYAELSAGEWEWILAELEESGARMTAGVTAGWVEDDGQVTPFPQKFPEAARMIRQGAERGLVEVANHGYTHCVLQDGMFRPRLFHGNRPFHREFYEWLPETVHREHVSLAQKILQDYLGRPIVTFVPPGNVFTRVTLAAAAEAGLRFVSCLEPGRWGAVEGLTFVGSDDVAAIHDRDLVLGGRRHLRRLLAEGRARPYVTVREVGEREERARP